MVSMDMVSIGGHHLIEEHLPVPVPAVIVDVFRRRCAGVCMSLRRKPGKIKLIDTMGGELAGNP